LFWVALRADVGTHLDEDPAAYAPAFQRAARVGGRLRDRAFAAGIARLSAAFWLGGAVYLAALALLLAGRRPKQQRTRVGEDDRAVGLRRVGRVLAPLLAVTALTAGTEISLGLLLILHLESAFDLDPQTIALLFFPGESCSWCCPSERSK
jgi:hypothetical protein